jgi:hypothetical protein
LTTTPPASSPLARYGNGNCYGWSSGTGLGQYPVRHFHAEITIPGDPKPFATAKASVYFHNPAADVDNVDDIDLSQLAQYFDSQGLDVCTELALMPTGSHFAMSSENDEGFACDAGKASGLSTAQLIKRAATLTGGAVAIDWLLYDASRDHSGGTLPLYQPEPPATLPQAWDAPVAAAATRIQTLNPAAELTDADAQEIARRCVWLAAQAEVGTEACGRERLPIFVSGADVPSATNHDLEALGVWPSWLSLNYRPAADAPGPRDWYAGQGNCSSPAAGQSCDEYPFFATEQGGGDATPTPSLKLIDSGDNSLQGLRYGNFLTNCRMASGDSFLAVPVPPSVGIPTQTKLCNGKTS